MATNVSAIRSQIPGAQLTRTLERVLEDAQITGEIRLSGRKLREFSKIASKYKLGDTVVADLSKNRFSELPLEICEYVSIERIDCYNNVIRSIPNAVIQLQSLTRINLSRNQLTTLPEALCKILSLQVLLLGNNKLVSLPEEIRGLEKLMELDVSCNEISHLPPQIEDLENLRSLDLRRNLLVELPIEVTRLRLVKLDISGNRISFLPSELRLMESLVELNLHNNPLTSPPSYLCTRGRVHIFKYLEIQAIKEDRKRGIIDSEIIQSGRTRLDAKLYNLSLKRNKRYTMDSGYNTSEGSEKRWSQDLQDLSIDVEAQNIALRSAALTKEQRQERKRGMQMQLDQLRQNDSLSNNEISLYLNGPLNSPNTPSTLSPGGDSFYEDFFKNEFQEKSENDEKSLGLAKRMENGEKISYAQWKNNQINEDEKEQFLKNSDKLSSTSISSDLKNNTVDCNSFWNASDIESSASESQKPFPHIQTYREYKEALRQQRAAEYYKINRRPMTEGAASVTSDINSIHDESTYTHPNHSVLVPNHMTPQEEFQVRHSALMQEQQYQALLTQRRFEEKRKQKEAVLSYFKSRTSPPWISEKGYNVNGYGLTDITDDNTSRLNSQASTTTTSSSFSKKYEAVNPNFTMRREFDKAKEEAELIQQLKQAIETRLKVSLPEDVSAALMDGVVLCHLANHIRPRSVASIHVPSPAVPKLTMAKCRKNVENFLEACRNIGVEEDYICSAHDILEEKSAVCVAITVQELLKFHSTNSKRIV